MTLANGHPDKKALAHKLTPYKNNEILKDGSLTERGLESREQKVYVGAVAGIGVYMSINAGKYLKEKFEIYGVSTKKKSKFKALLGVCIMLGAAVLGAAIAKDVHAEDSEKKTGGRAAPELNPGEWTLLENITDYDSPPTQIDADDFPYALTAYDSTSGKVVILTGSTSGGGGHNWDESMIMYNYDFAKQELKIHETQPIEERHWYEGLSYDSESKKLIVCDRSDSNGTWISVYDDVNNNWTPKQKIPDADVGGPLKSGYDSKHDKTVFISAIAVEETPADANAWIYDFNTNTLKQTGTTSCKEPVCMGYDSKNDKTVAFTDDYSNIGVSVYDYSSNNWSVKPKSSPYPAAIAIAMGATYSPDTGKFVVLHNIFDANPETWTYDLNKNEWVRQEVSGASPNIESTLCYSSVTYDPAHGITFALDGSGLWGYKLPETQQTLQIKEAQKYFPTRILDSTEKYMLAEMRGDDADVKNNHENYDKTPEKFLVNGKQPVYFSVVDYPDLNKKVYVYGFYRAFNKFYVFDDHEHDAEYAFVEVDKITGKPTRLALSWHLFAPRVYDVSDVKDLEYFVEKGGGGGGKQKWEVITDGNGGRIGASDAALLPLADTLSQNAAQDLDSNSKYKTDEFSIIKVTGMNVDNRVIDPEKYVFGAAKEKDGWMKFKLGSPAEISVELGKKVTSKDAAGIPNSGYESKDIVVLGVNSADKPKITVAGTGNGTIHLEGFLADDKPYRFTMEAPITGKTVYEIYPDWQAIEQNKNNSIEIRIDDNGDGKFDRTVFSDNNITADEIAAGKPHQKPQPEQKGFIPGFSAGALTLAAIAEGLRRHFRKKK